MNLSDVITRVADETGNTTTVSGVSARYVRQINRVCSEVWNSFAWSFRWRNYRIVTDVDYKTGTVTATNGSRSVTISSGSFSSSHVNWHIVFTGDSVQNWYKVRAFTSTSQIELDAPYQGTTGSGKAFILRHFDYVLPTEPWDLGSISLTSNRRILDLVDPLSVDLVGPVPLMSGYPHAAAIYESDVVPTTYSTGTVTGTIDTQTITGSGTSWLGNIYPGDAVTMGSYTYTVRSVDSDTQITLYNGQQISSSGVSYSIKRQFGRIIRIVWPSTSSYTIDVRGLRMYAPLVNNNDSNELFYRFPNVICLKTAAMELRSRNDIRSTELSKEADVEIMKAKAEDDALTKKENVYPIYSYRTNSLQYGRLNVR